MVCAAVDDTQGIACFCEIKIQFSYDGICVIPEINGNNAAYGRGCLVHQTTHFAKVHIFRILTNLGDFHRCQFIFTIQCVDDCSHQHFVSRRRRNARAFQYIGNGVHIQTTQCIAHLCDFGSHPTNERSCCVDFFFFHFQIIQRNFLHAIAFGENTNDAAVIFCCRAKNIQIYCRRQYTTMLMVCMVAADFRSAGCAEKTLRFFVECICKAFFCICHPSQIKIRLCFKTGISCQKAFFVPSLFHGVPPVLSINNPCRNGNDQSNCNDCHHNVHGL